MNEAITDLGGWLRTLGRECYESWFRNHAIDDTVLASLTAEDLRGLGIGIVDHRRKLMNAICRPQRPNRRRFRPCSSEL